MAWLRFYAFSLIFISAQTFAHKGEDYCPHGDTLAVNKSAWRWQLPKNFPVPHVPEDNPMSKPKVDLGRHLFYDKRLSANESISCSSCHEQARAFSDGKARSSGATGERTTRNAQHLPNVAWHVSYTWANPALTSLERQMLIPIFGEDPIEMGISDTNKLTVLARISRQNIYKSKFRTAFPDDKKPISWDNIIKAISSFQRTLISGNSRFDRYQRGEIKLTEAEIRGKDLFFGEKAECFHCHGSFNFNDQVVHQSTREVEMPFHNTGLYNLQGRGNYPAGGTGLIDVSGKVDDMGKFRAPSLRNVEVTAPYMHDGSITTLDEVVATYAAGGRDIRDGEHAGDGRRNPHKSELIGNIDLSKAEQSDIVAFLRTLTDREFLKNPRFSNPFKKAQ
jgi:cytochrome c peroxidase